MANPEHLACLKDALDQGNLDIWHQWRRKTLEVDGTIHGADFSGADLRGAIFNTARFQQGAKFIGANLIGAQLPWTDLSGADFTDAILRDAWFQDAILRSAIFHRTDLEVAQFIYLLLENRKIRNVIDTVTSKAVLILGRFAENRKGILESIHKQLREKHGLVPILFDFPSPPKRDLTETVMLLANMCRFIIADLTDAKSIPQELSHVIPDLPSVPVQPILLTSQRSYAMYEHFKEYNWVLPDFLYKDEDHLLTHLEDGVLTPVKRWEESPDKKASAKERLMEARIADKEAENVQLQTKLSKLEDEIQRLRSQK